MPLRKNPGAGSCTIDRARFLRSTALTALAGIAGAAILADPAFAQVGSIAPTQSHGNVLTYALPAKEGALIDADRGVIVARVKNTVYALSITCPHRAVTTLEWIPETKEFHCPKHHGRYRRGLAAGHGARCLEPGGRDGRLAFIGPDATTTCRTIVLHRLMVVRDTLGRLHRRGEHGRPDGDAVGAGRLCSGRRRRSCGDVGSFRRPWHSDRDTPGGAAGRCGRDDAPHRHARLGRALRRRRRARAPA